MTITKTLTLANETMVNKILTPQKIELDCITDVVTLTYTEAFEDAILGGAVSKTIQYAGNRNPQVNSGAKFEAAAALQAFVDGTLTILEE